MRNRGLWGALALGLAIAPAASAQRVAAEAAATGVLAWFGADPTPAGARSEVRVTQLMATGRLRWRGLDGRLALNGEGAVLAGGELAPGNWGEGFVDRRHPHTWVHEVMVGGTRASGAVAWGGFTGKGFVPFGSDDPMGRPFIRYPVNHHLAQILERAVVLAQAAAGPVLVEAAAFNGDEPERPAQWPRLARFGDSWSLRITARPPIGLEGSASFASVASPEHRAGAGPRQAKAHAAVRYEGGGPPGGWYGLVEWARTAEHGDRLVLRSLLAEGSLRRGRHQVHYRFERSDRPEEERLTPFRTARPHFDNTVLGVTRWTLHSVGHGWRIGGGAPLTIRTAVEATWGSVARRGGGAFDPIATYGRTDLWSLTVGIRVGWRDGPHRMGRYGLAEHGGG